MPRKATLPGSPDRAHEVPLAAIREISERDLPRLLAMYADFESKQGALGLPPAKPEDQQRWLHAMFRTGFNFVAEEEGRLVAHLVLIRVGDLAQMAVFVHQDFRRHGIGTALLRVALEQARDMGLRQVLVVVHPQDAAIQQNLLQLGFALSRETDSGNELVLTL